MQNLDRLIRTVYDETGILGDITVSFDRCLLVWTCSVGEQGSVWLATDGDRYLSYTDTDLMDAWLGLDQLCARQPVAGAL